MRRRAQPINRRSQRAKSVALGTMASIDTASSDTLHGAFQRFVLCQRCLAPLHARSSRDSHHLLALVTDGAVAVVMAVSARQRLAESHERARARLERRSARGPMAARAEPRTKRTR